MNAPATDWIEWAGGECPVQDGTRHQVRYRDGIVGREKYAIHGARSPSVWAHDPEMPRFDIIAYRVVSALASTACPVCGLDEPHSHNALEAIELRGRRFPIENDEWLRYLGLTITPALVNELDLLHKKAVREVAGQSEALAALIGLKPILDTAESNASGNPEWDDISARVNAARAALATVGAA